MTDKQARDIVINRIDKNVFTPAGAGSGKTTSLVARLVNMVKEGIKVDNICTITFTVNAANEFYQRFQKRLIQESQAMKVLIENAPDPNSPLLTNNKIVYERLLEALKNIDNCFMGTIDSFFQSVVTENSIKTDFPIGIEICSEDDFCLFLDNEFEKFVKSKNPNVKILIDNFGIGVKEKFRDVISILYQYKKYNITYKKTCINDIDILEKNNKNRLLNFYDIAANNQEIGLYPGKSKQVDIYNKYIKNYKKYIDCKWIDDLLTIKEFFSNASEYSTNTQKNILDNLNIKYKKDLPSYIIDFLDEAKEIKNIALEINNKITGYFLTLFFDNSLILANQVYKDKLDTTLVLHDDIIQAFYDLLIDDLNNGCSLINRIKNKYQYFLLDEFQDTKPICSDIFYILASSSPNADIAKCVLDKGKLFIVGDSKQSIYKFSGADIVAFNRIGSNFIPNLMVDNVEAKLTQNFRSVDQLKAYFNDTFNPMFVLGKYQTNYDNIDIVGGNKKINHFKDLKGNVIDNAVFRYETDKNRDPENVINIINTIVNNDNYIIEYPDKDENDNDIIVKRKIGFSDIMVITYSKDNLSTYARELARNNIPCYVEGKNDFSNSKSLMAVIAILSLMINKDKISMYKLLNSEIVNLSDDEIVNLNNLKLLSLSKVDELSKLGYGELAKLYSNINSLIKETYELPLSSIFEKVIVQFNIFDNTNKAVFQYAYSALETLKAAEANGEVCNAYDGLAFLEDLIASRNERSFNVNKKYNGVHLANLHKVKGLEAPIVILAYSFNSSHSNIIHANNIKKEVNLLGFDGIGKFGDVCTVGLEQEEKNAVDDEKIRLLYVAATRAGNALIISDIQLRNVWEKLLTAKDEISDFEYDAKDNSQSIIVPDYKYNKLNNIDSCNERTYNIVKPSDDFKYSDSQPQVSKIKTEISPVIIGTIVHKLMESIVTSNFLISDFDLLVSKVLDQYNIDNKYASIFINICEKMVNEGYTQEIGRNDLFKYLKENKAKCYCEVPFAVKDGDNIVNGIIDLIYTTDDINYIIIDYKTDSNSNDINNNHRQQLELYKKSFKEQYNMKIVEAMIYHIEVKE